MLALKDKTIALIFSKSDSNCFYMHTLFLFMLIGSGKNSFCMETADHIDITKLDKDHKTVLLNILSITSAFVENTGHMLYYLKKIDKHKTGSIAPDAEISAYPTAPFELPGEKACIIDFKNAALKYEIIDNDECNAVSFKKNDTAKDNNIKRINHLLYDKMHDYNVSKVATQGLGAQIFLKQQLFGKNPAYFFADPQDMIMFNQQHLAPDTLMFFLKNHQNINAGQKPIKKDFNNDTEQDIYHYFSLLYSFDRLLNLEYQIPLFNVTKLGTYLSMPGDRDKNANLANSDFLLKNTYQKEHWFSAFIPLLINQDSMVNDFTINNPTRLSKTVSNINTKKRTFALDKLSSHKKTIADIDAIYNAVFHLCFIMNKTRAIPINLGEIIESIENKFKPLLDQPEYTIDPLYKLYEQLYSPKTPRHPYFYGPMLLQTSSLLPETIFDKHISSAMKEKIALSIQEKERAAENADKVAQALLLECDSKRKPYNKQKNRFNADTKSNKQKDTTLSSTISSGKKNEGNTVTKKSDTSVAKNKKKIIKQEPIISTCEDVEPANLTLPSVADQEITIPIETIVPAAQPSLLFNKKYFERLTDTKNKELHDHYHGIPAQMISDIIHHGTTFPSPKDPTATIFFGVAAVRTVLQTYLYRIACVIARKHNNHTIIFHVGLHKEDNAVKTLGLIASAKIKEFKNIIDWPSLDIAKANTENQSSTPEGQEFSTIPANSIAIPFDEFDRHFPCYEKKPSNYDNTRTYVLPNKEELICLQNI